MADTFSTNVITLTFSGTTYKEYFDLDVYNSGYTVYWSLIPQRASGGTSSRMSIFNGQVNGGGSRRWTQSGEITYAGYSYGSSIANGSYTASGSSTSMSAGAYFYYSSGSSYFATTGSCTYYLSGLCDCETTCELSCQGTCESYCQNCEGACETTCETTGACQTTCQASCQTTCELSCQETCQICQATCQITCQTQCESCEAACQITAQTTYITTVPTQSGTLTYNGSVKTPSWNNFNTTQLTIGGNDLTATNAGTYTVTFTPKSGYAWSDGSAYKTATWTINKASASITPPATQSIMDSTARSVTYANTGNGTVSAVSNNTGVCTVTIDTSTKTLTINPVNNGSATITLTSTSTNNYNSATASFTVNVGIAAYNTYVKINGAWKQSDAIYEKVNGEWKQMQDIKVKVNGTWR